MCFGFRRRRISKIDALTNELVGARADILDLTAKVNTVMTKLEEIAAGLDKVDAAIAAAEAKIDADAATIKEDVAKLAAMAAAPQGASDADLSPLVTRINAMADGLTKHLTPVADAVPADPTPEPVATGATGATGT